MALTLPEYPDERGARCVGCNQFIIIPNEPGGVGCCDDCESVGNDADRFLERSDEIYDAWSDDRLTNNNY